MNNKKEQKYIEDMVGRTFNKVYVGEYESIREYKTEALIFEDDEYVFYFTDVHQCNDNAFIESITGDLSDLVGFKMLKAGEYSNKWNGKKIETLSHGEACFLAKENKLEEFRKNNPIIFQYEFDYEWTFYKFATKKGYVDVRWFADIPQHYSCRVDLIVVKK